MPLASFGTSHRENSSDTRTGCPPRSTSSGLRRDRAFSRSLPHIANRNEIGQTSGANGSLARGEAQSASGIGSHETITVRFGDAAVRAGDM